MTRKELRDAINWVVDNHILNSLGDVPIIFNELIVRVSEELANTSLEGLRRNDDGFSHHYDYFKSSLVIYRKKAFDSGGAAPPWDEDLLASRILPWIYKRVMGQTASWQTHLTKDKNELTEELFTVSRNHNQSEDRRSTEQRLKYNQHFLERFFQMQIAGTTSEGDKNFPFRFVAIMCFLGTIREMLGCLERPDMEDGRGTSLFVDVLNSKDNTFTLYRGVEIGAGPSPVATYLDNFLIKSFKDALKSNSFDEILQQNFNKINSTLLHSYLEKAMKTRLGESWSLSPDVGASFAGNKGLLLTSILHDTDVDWAYTFLLHGFLPKEAELRLITGKKLVVDNAALVVKSFLFAGIVEYISKIYYSKMEEEWYVVRRPGSIDTLSASLSRIDGDRVHTEMSKMIEKLHRKSVDIKTLIEATMGFLNAVVKNHKMPERSACLFWEHDGEYEKQALLDKMAEV